MTVSKILPGKTPDGQWACFMNLTIGECMMPLSDWLVICLNAFGASVLFNAGIIKLVSPDALRVASSELFPRVRADLIRRAVAGLAAAEIIVSLVLIAPGPRLVMTGPAAILGAGFAAAGLWGMVRGSSVPCGCFGSATGKPLGWRSLAFGLALAVLPPVNLAVYRGAPGIPYVTASALTSSIAFLAACLWLRRRHIGRLMTPVRAVVS